MEELPPNNQILETLEDGREKIDLAKLNFEELKNLQQEVLDLAKITFRQIEGGFVNINGDAIRYREEDGRYKLSALSPDLREFHTLYAQNKTGILQKGADSEEEMMQAIRQMIEETGGRIID